MGKGNRFAWINVLSGGGEQKSLVEFVSEHTVKFHGTVFNDGTSIKVVARDRDREMKTIEESLSSFEEGMLAVEKFLFDQGVLEEGCVIEYEQEEE